MLLPLVILRTSCRDRTTFPPLYGLHFECTTHHVRLGISDYKVQVDLFTLY